MYNYYVYTHIIGLLLLVLLCIAIATLLVKNSLFLLFLEILDFFDILFVSHSHLYHMHYFQPFINYYSIQNYEDVPLANKNRMIQISKQLKL